MRWTLYREKRYAAVAIIAAVLFVLQSVFSAWAAGPTSAPALDAFGNPLCLTSNDAHGGVPAGDHLKFPNCCTFGCSSTAVYVAMSSRIELTPAEWPRTRSRVLPQDCGNPIRAPEYDPGNPRAPPLKL